MSSTLKFTVWLVGIIVLLFLSTALFFYFNPIGVSVWLARKALDNSELEQRKVDGPRGTLSFWEGGNPDGHTVVLIHGMGNQAGTWVQVAPHLISDHRLVVVDLPGHGESEPLDGVLTLRDEVEGLAAILAAAAPEGPVTLVGNSLGGWVSLRYCLEYPEDALRVNKLVLVASAGIRGDLPPGVTLVPANREEARSLVEAMSPTDSPPPADFVLDDLVEKIEEGATPRLMRSIQESDFLNGRLGEVRIPTDLVWGTEDRLVPLGYGERLAAKLPDARMHRLPACGHLPQQQCPSDFLKLLRELLAGTG